MVPRWVAVQAEVVERTCWSLEPAEAGQWQETAGSAESGPWSYPSGYRVMAPGIAEPTAGHGAQQWGQLRILPCASSGIEQEGDLWILAWHWG